MSRLPCRVFTSVRTCMNLNAASVIRLISLDSNSALETTMEHKLYQAPSGVRGMTSLDKMAFTQDITVPALRVPAGAIHKVVKCLKNCTLQRPGMVKVVQDPENSGDSRLILLDPHRILSKSSFSEAEAEVLQSLGVGDELLSHELQITYDNLKTEEVLGAVLPQGQEVSSGFSRVGHIAHMNLRDHQLPYKNLIGQVLIDKNRGITSVVNKTNIIDSTYRNFKMELLAGEENMLAKVKENGARYEFDFSRVYWNPRLSTEHQRVVDLVGRGDTVFDVFAGVGPFAVPAARSGAHVFANDLNPESHRWLQHNCKLNKAARGVRTFNMDGRAFIRGPVKQELPALLNAPGSVHVVMNLPALALEFLDAFRGLLRERGAEEELPSEENLPTVHCYGFSKDDDPDTDMIARASDSLGVSLKDRCSVHFVRNVAPNKNMMCVRFRLPKDVLFSSCEQEESEASEEPALKRRKCEETEETTQEKSFC